MSFHVPEQYRIPPYSTPQDGNNGAFSFYLQVAPEKRHLRFFTIASDGAGWEHVSVSLPDRCPTWAELCAIKNLFWDEEDCVVQYHPPKSDYVNNHQFCLHLWRPIGVELPRPPAVLVGAKAAGVML